MKFIEKIAGEASKVGGNERVKSVYIGLSYCLTVLENGHAGLAFVFKDDLVGGCNIDLPNRPLAGASAGKLLDFAGSGFLANSIALSVANAVFAPHVDPSSHGDFIDHFQIQAGTKVGMVGHFGPLEPLIRERGAELVIFDLHPAPFSKVIHSKEIPDILPKCDVAILTATSIINETADDLLVHAAQCKYVAMIGPSTPLAAACYTDTPVSCAGGALVRKKEAMIQAVVEAGGMRIFSPFIDKVNVIPESCR